MSGSDLQSTPQSDSAALASPPARQYQELWFTMLRRNWASVVLVPADVDGSAESVARSLVEAGRWARGGPITLFVMSKPVDYATSAQIIASPGVPSAADRIPEKVVIAIQPVIAEPLGLAVAKAADAVILCIEKGSTHLDAARRTIEMIGRDRIAGSLFIT
jgi:hypothetical protein